MNFRGSRKTRTPAALEITPLVDVVFLLLIFFLLTATYTKNPNLDINLPKASPQELFNKTKDVSVGIMENGTIKYENRVVDIADLEKHLHARLREDGADAVVIIKADKGAKHGAVVEVMDVSKKVGFNKLAIAVDATSSLE
ncbi:MAG: biopolymer transporter ExbD [Proteobacteria bacterium]|nr:biopolymer transporter ExbD [Pseudomonadota bacterium]